MKAVMLALGRRPDLRLWRQNTGTVKVKDDLGRVLRVFSSGAPKGAADVTGFVVPEGWRLELEFKAARGTRSPEQVSWARVTEASGVVYALIRYDAKKTLDANVAAAVATVDAALIARRSR